jgi:hypothetical protein
LYERRDSCGYGSDFEVDRYTTFFVEGSESDPQCKCGKLIREHFAQHPAAAAPASPTTSELINFNKNFIINVPENMKGVKFSGRKDFFSTLHATMLVLVEKQPCVRQDTIAVALMTTSGTGKTFGTCAFRKVMSRVILSPPLTYEPFAVYLGLNQGWPLTPNEIGYISSDVHRSDPNKYADAISRILLLRTLVSLSETLKHSSSDLSIFDDETSDCQKIPLPSKYLFSEVSESTEDLRTSVCSLLCSLQQKCCGAKELGLLLILDEAQFLDEMVPSPASTTTEEAGGARLALRALRELQLHIAKQKCKVNILPIATGIRFETTLTSITTGRNIIMRGSGAHLSREEFLALARTVHSDAIKNVIRGGRDEATVYTLLAAIHYPCVRQLVNRPTEIHTVNVDLKADRPPLQQLGQILRAGFTRHTYHALPRKDIPVTCPIEALDDILFFPLIPLCLWTIVLHQISRELGYTLSRPNIPTDVASAIAQNKDSTFEDAAYDTMGLWMAIFMNPAMNVMDRIMRSTIPTFLNEWLPEFLFSLKHHTRLQHQKERYNPFDSLTSHEEAAKGPMCPEVVAGFNSINDGEALWFYCGGSAPIDFILMVKYGTKVELRFMDAKHCSVQGQQMDLRNNTKMEMQGKAKMVHAGMKRELDKIQVKGKFVVSDYKSSHLLLITNTPSEEGGVLNPKNFNWEPWTTLLYLRKSSKGEN